MAISAVIDSMETDLRKEKLNDIENHRDEIEELLKFEIISRYYYQKGKIIASLENDPELKEAMNVLKDKILYQSILSGTYARNDKPKTE